MKILLATESYYPNIDGGAIAQYNLIRELKKLGHEPYVLAPGFSYKNYVEDIDGIQVFRTKQKNGKGILFLGRISPIKNLETLIIALSKVVKKHPKLK